MKEDLYKGNRDEKGRFIKGVPSKYLQLMEKYKLYRKREESWRL